MLIDEKAPGDNQRAEERPGNTYRFSFSVFCLYAIFPSFKVNISNSNLVLHIRPAVNLERQV